MGLGSLQGVHSTSERAALSFCFPSVQEKTNNTASHIQSTVQFHFTFTSAQRIGSGTHGQISHPAELMDIDQTLPGSHWFWSCPKLSIAIYSLEARLSNLFWVNPAFVYQTINLLSAALLLICLPWEKVLIWYISRQTCIKGLDHHLIRVHWIQIEKKNMNEFVTSLKGWVGDLFLQHFFFFFFTCSMWNSHSRQNKTY